MARASSTQSVNPLLVGFLIIAAFVIGSLITKIQYMEKNGSSQTTQTAQASPSPIPTLSVNTVKALFNEKNLTFGDKNSKNLLVEIADPSCPYCHIAGGLDPELNRQDDRFKLVSEGGTYVAPVEEMRKLVDSGQAAFVWIYYPGHRNGEMGQKALYCANEKGKFWQVHDKLMSNDGYNLLNGDIKNDKTKSGELADFLSGIFDPTDMKNCLDSGKYDSKLQDDINTANNLFKYFPSAGTPGFIVNTTVFAGAYSWKDMESALNK